MKTASQKEIKTALELLPQPALLAVCLRLVKFKKENKELLNYLLFEESDESSYIDGVKNDINLAFGELNTKNMYIAKKNIRKIIRLAGRYTRYSSLKTTEITVLMHVCLKINQSGLELSKSVALTKIYASLIKKIKAAVTTLHEDLQYDYLKEMERIE